MDERPKRQLSESHRAAISKARLGMRFSDEHRARLAESHRGNRPNDATRAKMSATRTGRTQSPEARAKVSAARQRGTAIGLAAAHSRAWTVLPPVCEAPDATCRGRLEAAFRHDAPTEFVRHGPTGTRYYVGPDPRDGYRRLCQSHHSRYDRTHVD